MVKKFICAVDLQQLLCKGTCSPCRKENNNDVVEIGTLKDPSVAHSAARTGGSELVRIAVAGSKIL